MTRSPPPIPKMKPQPSFFDPQPPKASEDQSKGAVKSSKPGPPKIDRNEPLDYIVMADHKLGALWTHKRRPRTAPALQAVTDAGKETTTTSEETGKERQITLAPGTPTIEEVTMYEESLLRDSEAKASTPRLQKKEPKELFYPVGTGRPVENPITHVLDLDFTLDQYATWLTQIHRICITDWRIRPAFCPSDLSHIPRDDGFDAIAKSNLLMRNCITTPLRSLISKSHIYGPIDLLVPIFRLALSTHFHKTITRFESFLDKINADRTSDPGPLEVAALKKLIEKDLITERSEMEKWVLAQDKLHFEMCGSFWREQIDVDAIVEAYAKVLGEVALLPFKPDGPMKTGARSYAETASTRRYGRGNWRNGAQAREEEERRKRVGRIKVSVKNLVRGFEERFLGSK